MPPTYELYTYFRSSCSARVRIAAAHKGIALSYRFIHLLQEEQKSAEYQCINASQSVPTLVVTASDGQQTVISQSIAALDFLEEQRPDLSPLLPAEAAGKAAVRELINIIACDVQPVTNLRVLQRVKELGAEANEWQCEWMTRGLLAYEATMMRHGMGRYSFGDSVTMADVVLAPAVDAALRFAVDMAQMPHIQQVYAALQELDAFRAGSWRTQPDTPSDIRVE